MVWLRIGWNGKVAPKPDPYCMAVS
jgi:hypothetical protein